MRCHSKYRVVSMGVRRTGIPSGLGVRRTGIPIILYSLQGIFGYAPKYYIIFNEGQAMSLTRSLTQTTKHTGGMHQTCWRLAMILGIFIEPLPTSQCQENLKANRTANVVQGPVDQQRKIKEAKHGSMHALDMLEIGRKKDILYKCMNRSIYIYMYITNYLCQVSNLGPFACQANALPTELQRQLVIYIYIYIYI